MDKLNHQKDTLPNKNVMYLQPLKMIITMEEQK